MLRGTLKEGEQSNTISLSKDNEAARRRRRSVLYIR